MNQMPRRSRTTAVVIQSIRAAGFGLIELMVGIIIGSLLLLGLTQVFSTTRNAYQTSEGLARAQENSRFAMDFLQRDIRMAGHQGCVSDVGHFTNPSSIQLFSHFLTGAQRAANNWAAAPWGLQFDKAIEGFEYTGTDIGGAVNISGNTDPVPFGAAGSWSPALPAELTGANADANPGVVSGGDVIVVRTFDSSSIPVTAINQGVSPVQIVVPLAYASKVVAGNLYGLADCTKASVFQASSSANPATGMFTVGVGGLNLSDFQGGEGYNAKQLQLYPLHSVAYFIGRGSDGGPALRRMNFSGGCTVTCQSEELVDGIENMQFLYGYDSHGGLPDGAIDVYWTASKVVNQGPATSGSIDNAWRRIGSVRFGFISRSLDTGQTDKALAATAPLLPNVLGVVVTPNTADGRLREVYTSTTAVRNQLFGN